MQPRHPPTYTAYRCSCCGRVLALTNGARLLLGEGAYTDEPTPLKCASCGKRSYWRPVRKPLAATDALAAT